MEPKQELYEKRGFDTATHDPVRRQRACLPTLSGAHSEAIQTSVSKPATLIQISRTVPDPPKGPPITPNTSTNASTSANKGPKSLSEQA